MAFGLRTLFGALGRLGRRFSGRVGPSARYTRLTNNLGGKVNLGASRLSLASSKLGASRLSLVPNATKRISAGKLVSAGRLAGSYVRRIGRGTLKYGRSGLKSVYRKLQVDPVGSITGVLKTVNKPQTQHLTIDGLDRLATRSGSNRNFEAFSSW